MFVESIPKLVDLLGTRPETKVKIAVSPDDICSACPHLSNQGCTLKGKGHESHMRQQDMDVLRRLKLKEGEEIRWIEITNRISKNIATDKLHIICKGCPWLPSGLCAKGIDRLKNTQLVTEANSTIHEHYKR